MTKVLAEDTRSARLVGLPTWTFDPARNALYRQIVFANFSSMLAAMVRIGIVAENAEHQPEWTNVYNRLDIWLTTHGADGVSDRDFALASHINAIVGTA